MNNQAINEVSEKRYQALLKVTELSQQQRDNEYTAFDFMLDRLLRERLKLPRKEVGKAPYDFIEL